MPATSEEVDEAEAEGVKVMYLVSPKELIRSNGSIQSLRMVNHVLGKQDASGRRRPEEVEGTEFTLQGGRGDQRRVAGDRRERERAGREGVEGPDRDHRPARRLRPRACSPPATP